MGFYSVEYAWSKATTRKKGAAHIKRGAFSPDFFIKQNEWIFVVEIKDDSEIGDPSLENIRKHEYASAHFERLNLWLEDLKETVRYQFNMLTPQDYGVFFEHLRKIKLEGYRSRLDAAILSSDDAEEDLVIPVFRELDVVKISSDAYEEEGLKQGEEGTIVLVHTENDKRAYEVEFDGWEQNWPIKVKTLRGDEIEMVKKWSG